MSEHGSEALHIRMKYAPVRVCYENIELYLLGLRDVAGFVGQCDEMVGVTPHSVDGNE